MTTNAALAFCSDAWWGLILNVFWGPQGGHKFHWGAAPLAPLGTAPDNIPETVHDRETVIYYRPVIGNRMYIYY